MQSCGEGTLRSLTGGEPTYIELPDAGEVWARGALAAPPVREPGEAGAAPLIGPFHFDANPSFPSSLLGAESGACLNG